MPWLDLGGTQDGSATDHTNTSGDPSIGRKMRSRSLILSQVDTLPTLIDTICHHWHCGSY
eukprot:scaffold196779_cov28-Tisochrysis_lutea.AAC.2